MPVDVAGYRVLGKKGEAVWKGKCLTIKHWSVLYLLSCREWRSVEGFSGKMMSLGVP